MVFFNYALRKLNAKIVYYGPGLCGKTTNLQWIHDHFEGGRRGEMISLATEGDRTIFFDLLPLEIGKIRGLDVTLQLYTVPGQVHYNSTRQLVLKGADGVVFVADSQRAMRASNADSWKNLKENLLLQGVELATFPHVLQFNKRDLRDIMSLEEMDQVLNEYDAPFHESVATDGIGVQETLEGIVKLVMRSLRDRYEPVGRPEDRSTLQAPQPGGGLRPAGAPPAAVAAFKPPAPDVSLAPPAGEPSEEVSDEASGVSEEAVTHPSMSIPSPPDDRPWAPGDFNGDGGPVWMEPGDGSAFEPPAPQPEPGRETAPRDAGPPTEPGTALGSSPVAAGTGLSPHEDVVDGEDLPVGGEVTVEISQPAAGAPVPQAQGAAAPEGAAQPPDEKAEGTVTAEWEPASGEIPARGEPGPSVVEPARAEESAATVGPDRDEESSPFPLVDEESAVPQGKPFATPAPPSETTAPADGTAADAEPFAADEPSHQPTPGVDELEGTAAPGEAGSDAAGDSEAEELLMRALETPMVDGADEPAGMPGEKAAEAPVPRPAGPAAEAQPGEPPAVRGTPAQREAPEPIVFGADDPFAFAETADEAPVRAEASAVVTVPSQGPLTATAGPDSHGGASNQLQLRIEGTQALARSGDVRELDIMVPVPGGWIGNRRVTLQLRLTLVPGEEEP